jgi:hypothetical protein
VLRSSVPHATHLPFLLRHARSTPVDNWHNAMIEIGYCGCCGGWQIWWTHAAQQTYPEDVLVDSGKLQVLFELLRCVCTPPLLLQTSIILTRFSVFDLGHSASSSAFKSWELYSRRLF